MVPKSLDWHESDVFEDTRKVITFVLDPVTYEFYRLNSWSEVKFDTTSR